MNEHRTTWSEEASAAYRSLADVAVPNRDEQLATLLALLPFGRDDEFRAVELGSGEGILSASILEAYPRASILSLDGSETMREQTQSRLAAYGERGSTAPFDLLGDDWLEHLQGVDAVVSSLVIHHLDDEGKRRLYQEIQSRLSERGVLLIADLVEPKHPEVLEYFADTYQREAHRRSRELTGSDELYEAFVAEEWNHFRFPDTEVDRPSYLFDQLRWLDEAGFHVVDAFWMRAGHAIYGGYQSNAAVEGERLGFDAALDVARRALGYAV